MTKKEVKAIKELEDWQRLAYHNDDGTDEDSHELYIALTTVFALINRQTAENEKLSKRLERQKHALFKQQSYTAELQAKIDGLQDEVIIKTDMLNKQKAEIEKLRDLYIEAGAEIERLENEIVDTKIRGKE